MKLSIVIPCYNEVATLRAVVDRVRAAPIECKEIIIVDDCSTDGTQALLRAEIAPLVPWLMMSAIMAEAASPIARDGDFAGISAEPFLKASLNLIDWISQRTRAVAAVLGD